MQDNERDRHARQAHGAQAEGGEESSAHIVQRYDRRLERLTAMTLDLGERAATRLTQAFSLFGSEAEARSAFVAEDGVLNSLSHDIVDSAVATIATRQPMGEDLRSLVALIRIPRDLERVADCAAGLASRTDSLRGAERTQAVALLKELAAAAQTFLRRVLADYRDGTDEVAGRGAEMDDHLDALYERMLRTIQEEAASGGISGEDSLQLLLAAKHLERAGDHITHVADAIFYIRTGHYPSPKPKDA